MTPERLAEMDAFFSKGLSKLIGVNERTANELLQALKAEREAVSELERQIAAVPHDSMCASIIGDKCDCWKAAPAPKVEGE